MARSNHPLWIFLFVASPSLADPRESAKASLTSTKNVRERSADKPRILADEHGTLVADQHGTLLADEHGKELRADQDGAQVLADEHGTLTLVRQQVLADEHGKLVLDIHTLNVTGVRNGWKADTH